MMEHCVAFAARHLEDLSREAGRMRDFCSLPAYLIENVIKHQGIPCSELTVYKMVAAWYRENGADPGGNLSLMNSVRFPLMSLDELKELAGSDRNITVTKLVREAIEHHARYDGDDGLLLEPSVFVDGVVDRKLLSFDGALRFRQRCPIGCVPLIFTHNGDTNGVIHFIATRYGTLPWSNPVSAGLVSIVSSSPTGRFSDPKALVSKNFSRLNFAGPRRVSNGVIESWWTVDIGEGHGLRCTRYSLRHDESADYLRDWHFQGSTDGMSWENLSSHSNDLSLRMPGQYSSWPVRDARRRTFRHFRILQTVPNRRAPNPTHVSLAHIELYGDFFVR